VHKGLREVYGEPYREGDVIGCLLHLPPGGRAFLPNRNVCALCCQACIGTLDSRAVQRTAVPPALHACSLRRTPDAQAEQASQGTA
jgi:hypothetical protein